MSESVSKRISQRLLVVGCALFAFLLSAFTLSLCACPLTAHADDLEEPTDLTPGTIEEEAEPEPEPVTPVPMYRLYNPNNSEHFYTGSAYERDVLDGLGWNYEGVGWYSPELSESPVYRLYNPNAGDHHYTMSATERDYLDGVGWVYEGIGWYSDDEKTTPVYRQYNPNADTGTHNFTCSKGENDYLVSVGWRAEGIAWYGCKSAWSDDATWFSKTHLHALANSLESSSDIVLGENTTVDSDKLQRLRNLLDTDVPIAFVAVNARTGKCIARDADRRFYGASTIKAPYIAALCKYDAPNISDWIDTMEDVIRWSSNEGFNDLVNEYGTSYETAFASESTVTLNYEYGGAYVDLSPRELAKLWITIREYVISSEPNSSMFRSLFDAGYRKEGWMYSGMLGGQVYHVGGIYDDVVYAIMTRYEYGDEELWDLRDAIVNVLT